MSELIDMIKAEEGSKLPYFMNQGLLDKILAGDDPALLKEYMKNKKSLQGENDE